VTAWRRHETGIILAVRVTPRAARDAVEGLLTSDDGRQAVVIRLTAAPTDGAANDALIRLLAKILAIPKRDIRLESGTTSRLKRLSITGDPQALAARLDIIAGDKDGR